MLCLQGFPSRDGEPFWRSSQRRDFVAACRQINTMLRLDISFNEDDDKRAIEAFLNHGPYFAPQNLVRRGLVLLDLCEKISDKKSTNDLYYIKSRSVLASMLRDTLWPRYLTNLTSAAVVQRTKLFVEELTQSVLSGLETEYMAIGSTFLTDLSNFLSAWKGMDGSQMEHEKKDQVASLHGLFQKFLSVFDQCLWNVENYVQRNGRAQSKLRISVWACLVDVLRVLNAFAKIFDGAEAEQLIHEVLLKRWFPLKILLRQAERKKKLCWTDFEATKNLLVALMLLPEEVEDEVRQYQIRIDRSQLLTESFEYIGQVQAFKLHYRLSLKFKYEGATGAGVLREWLCLLCKRLFDPQKGLFLPCPCDLRRFFPNPAFALDPLHLEYFNFSGRVIALALMHNVQVGIVFDRTFFLQLAGKPIALEDVRDADPTLYKSLKHILETDADALELTFAREIEEQGSRRTAELCPGGEDIKVNNDNKKQYVELLIEHLFVTSVSPQVASFSQGFADLLRDSEHQKLIFQNMDLKDFDLILGGSGSVIDVEDWKEHTEYNGYQAEDPQISWFWQIVEGMSEEQRRMLLFFWTSVMFLPIDGFGGLASKLYICRSEESLPRSYTCFYRLYLPPYETELVMYEPLQLITQEHVSSSFGLP